INGYYLKVSNTGGWAILKNTTAGQMTTLASGTVLALGINQWHAVTFGLQGTTLTATIDGTQVGSADDPDYTFGPAGIAVGADDDTRNAADSVGPERRPQSAVEADAGRRLLHPDRSQQQPRRGRQRRVDGRRRRRDSVGADGRHQPTVGHPAGSVSSMGRSGR